MMKTFFKLLAIILLFYITNCSNNLKINNNNQVIKTDPPHILYNEAMMKMDDAKYEEALLKFNEIYNKYPLSNEAIQSKIMIGFINYLQLNYIEAINIFNTIIIKYPSHKNIDYVYYIRAMCFFEQIEDESLDGTNNLKALDNFNQIIRRFPDSKYSRDSEQKIIFVKENIAAKHMNIALFYHKQKNYLAALNRYKIVIDESYSLQIKTIIFHTILKLILIFVVYLIAE